MKILYLITKSNWGGAQRHVFDLAVSMKDKGHEVKVALGGQGMLKTKLEAAGIYTYPISLLGRDVDVGKDAGSFKEIFSIIKTQKPDVLHLHSPKAAGLGALAGRLLRVKRIVQTVHGWTFNESRPLFERMSIMFFSWLTMILAHRTIVLATREYTQALYFPGIKEKVLTIPLGIRPPTFISIDGARNELGKKLGIEDISKKMIVGTIAELHPNKGLMYLIEAMSSVSTQIPNSICIIVGEGQEQAALHMLIKEKKMEQRIYLAGYLDHASEYLKAFTVFVLPSLKEGLPYTILEAGAASLAVVATTVGGIPEIVEDMRSGILVQPRKSRELAHALGFMIEHPAERRTYGNALRDRVINQFSIEKMTAAVEMLYKGVE